MGCAQKVGMGGRESTRELESASKQAALQTLSKNENNCVVSHTESTDMLGENLPEVFHPLKRLAASICAISERVSRYSESESKITLKVVTHAQKKASSTANSQK